MKKLLLIALLCVGSIAFSQTKEHKTLTQDFDLRCVGDNFHVFPCVLTILYYQNEQGEKVYDGPFSIVGEGYSRGVSPWGDWGSGGSTLSYKAYGAYVDGKLDGELTITRHEDFKSDKGEEAPRYWTLTCSFEKGVPSGVWDYSYFTTFREMNNPKAIARKEVIDSFHMTFNNGYPVGKFKGSCLSSRGEFLHNIYGDVFKLNQCEKVNIKGEITEDGKPNGEWAGLIENTKFINGMSMSTDNNANELAVKYLDGKISIEEIEEKGYVIDDYTDYYKYADKGGKCLNMIYFAYLLNSQSLMLNMNLFKNAMELDVCDELYWQETVRSWGCIYRKDNGFWTPAQVNTYIAKIQQVKSYDRGSTWSIIDYEKDLNKIYRRHDIKTIQYHTIKSALDVKKAELEKSFLEQIKTGINSQTSMVDLENYMKTINTETLMPENKEIVTMCYNSKYKELEDKELGDVLSAIKTVFDDETMQKMITVFPTKDLYKAFSESSRKQIDNALAKQLLAIKASKTLKTALDQIMLLSQEKKIAKKPVEVIEKNYVANPTNWEVFSVQSAQQLSEKIASFCPMSSYEILSVDYLEDGSFNYKVLWSKQLSKKEQRKYISKFTVLKDKLHVDLNSFDFSKAIE